MKNNNKANNNKANNVKIVPIGKTMTAADIAALEIRLAAAEAALAEERAAKAALEAKVKTTPKREQKAPDNYNVLQPVFVAIRGSINKGIVENSKLINIFNTACGELNIKVDNTIACKLFEKTIQHNSVSNIAKADSLSSAKGRKAAYEEMIEQFKVLITIIPAEKWEKYAADYEAAYNKATKNLQK